MVHVPSTSAKLTLSHRDRLTVFGEPPLLEGESSEAYDSMLTRILKAVRPLDIIEELWVRDVVDLSWEILRLRRLKARLIKANLHRGMSVVLEPLCGYKEAEQLAVNWAQRAGDVLDQVDQLLAGAAFTMEDVQAETLAVKISDIERIDRLIMNAEARRNAVLREIDRHRINFGLALRQAAGTVENRPLIEGKAANSDHNGQ